MREAKAGNSLIQIPEIMQSYLHLIQAAAAGRNYYIQYPLVVLLLYGACIVEVAISKQFILFYTIGA